MAPRLLLIVAVLGTAACGGGHGRAATDVPAGRPPGEALVVMLRYGGVSDSIDRVAVDVSGTASVVSERSPTPAVRALPARDFSDLRTALERSSIATLDRSYYDAHAHATDAYQYDVTYQGVTVTADDAVMPPKLRPVVDLLVRLIG